MPQISLDHRTLETLITQARMHPPRDAEALHAIEDAEQALRDVVMAPGPGQMALPV